FLLSNLSFFVDISLCNFPTFYFLALSLIPIQKAYERLDQQQGDDVQVPDNDENYISLHLKDALAFFSQPISGFIKYFNFYDLPKIMQKMIFLFPFLHLFNTSIAALLYPISFLYFIYNDDEL